VSGCLLCGHSKAAITGSEDWALADGLADAAYHVECPNCGNYKIEMPAYTLLTEVSGVYPSVLPSKSVLITLSGEVFDHWYYKNERKMITPDDFKTAKPLSTLEKLYKLAKFVFSASQNGRMPVLLDRPACCHTDTEELSDLANELFERRIITGTEGVRLTTRATLKFERGIATVRDFDFAFMRGDRIRDPSNALKASACVARRFPDVQWFPVEASIFIAQSRLPANSNQRDTLKKEIIQAQILADRGSTIYLLPEEGKSKHPDAIVDGYIMEFKTITGNIDRIEEHYKEARSKAGRIFFKIDSHLSQEAVLGRIIDRVKKERYTKGLVIAYFTHTGRLYFWEEDRFK
jgi:hypothetical protein